MVKTKTTRPNRSNKQNRPDAEEIIQKIFDSKNNIKNVVLISETHQGLSQVAYSDLLLGELSFYSEVLKLELYKRMTSGK